MAGARPRAYGPLVGIALCRLGPWLLLALLGGCAGAPPKPGEGPAPNAISRRESLSRYGNAESYWVNGVLYHTLPSAAGYRERGIASWYGPGFDGELTSSREPYDMYAMTAAHRSLPLPTYVRVTNLRNGKSIVVRVNDRGPFHPNRIIDLSYAAAQRLSILQDGTGLVEVAAIDPDHPLSPARLAAAPADEEVSTHPAASGAAVSGAPTTGPGTPPGTALASRLLSGPKAASAPQAEAEPREPRAATAPAQGAASPPDRPAAGASPGPQLFVQVGAFGNRTNAERLAARLSPEVAGGVHIQSVTRTSAPIYRVQIGPLSSVDSADALTDELRRLGLADSQVVAR
jgi:peptidoglycan lytic transglycosylase